MKFSAASDYAQAPPKMKSNEKNNCLYESNLPISQCFLGIVLALGLSMPALYLSANPIPSYFLTVAILSIIGWSLFLRKSFFYQDHVVITYPLRFFKRQIRIQYEDIEAFQFKEIALEGEFLSIITKEEESVLRKLYIKYFCSSMVSSRDWHKRMSFFYLLKYLKSEGYWIKIIDRSYGFTTLEKRVELAFGSGNSDYVRKSPSERRKRRKKDIIITIIAILIGLALGVLLPIRR